MSAIELSIPGYELQRRLGEGGMATVFLALQRSLDRKVAIKVMRRGATDASDEKRFLNEGRTLARLPHPNIVGVYDIVQCDEINYIAMEYLEGGVLSDRMRVGLTLAEAITIVVQISDALQFAHDNGVVHRDLKPANILFRGKRTPVLTDFGIARVNNQDISRLTRTGMMIGTPAYMSPEQAQGAPVDGRSDQYSLGVLFYEMLARQVPFVRDEPMQVAYAHVHDKPPPLPMKFSFAQPLIDRMLAKDPKDRFPDLKAFNRELKKILIDNPALQHRLNVNPAHNVSEQLRALGFSDSQAAGNQLRSAGVPVAVAKEDLKPGELVQQLLDQAEVKFELMPIDDRPRQRFAADTGGHAAVGSGRRPTSLFLLVISVAVAALVATHVLLR